MKRRVWITVALCILLFVMACSAKSTDRGPVDAFDPPDFSPTPAPSDYIQPGNFSGPDSYAGRYVRNKTVHADMVPMARITLPKASYFVKPTPDGGAIAILQVTVGEVTNGDPDAALRVIRFATDGSVLWDKQYNEMLFKGYLVSCCITEDGGFAVSLRVNVQKGMSIAADMLWRFSSDGKLLFKTKDGITAGALDQIFAAPGGALLAAGIVERENKFSVSVLRFEKDGKIKEYEGAGTDALILSASRQSDSGLVLVCRCYADPAQDTASEIVSKIMSFDEHLNLQWSKRMTLNEDFSEVLAADSIAGALVRGAVKKTVEGSSMKLSVPVLFHFDAKGVMDWTYTVEEDGISQATKLADGRYIAGIQHWQSGPVTSRFAVFSPDGKLQVMLEPLYGFVEQIVPTDDGGFTAVLRQAVRQLPQPPYISSIWADTEAVVVHYDRELNIVWMRTINQYKHERWLDVVVPTTDDRLLIG